MESNFNNNKNNRIINSECDENDLKQEEIDDEDEDEEEEEDNSPGNASPCTQENDSGGDSDGSERSLTKDEECDLYKVMDSILERCISHEVVFILFINLVFICLQFCFCRLLPHTECCFCTGAIS